MLQLPEAIAFGDNPAGNDAPLTKFVARGMPFISVAASLDATPEPLQSMHVGHLEHGTAACIELMNQARSVAGIGQSPAQRL